MPEATGVSSAMTFPMFTGEEDDCKRFCEGIEATMSATQRFQDNAANLYDDQVAILKTKDQSAETDADRRKKEEELRDHDLEHCKILLNSINKTERGEEAYPPVKGSKEGSCDNGCFKNAWKALRSVFGIMMPQDKLP
jgi:hypothetical protein